MQAEARQATTRDELPVVFPSGRETLCGMWVTPSTRPNGTAVVLGPAGGHGGSMYRNRGWVRLGRDLAGLGYHVLRFEFHGTGESTGEIDRFDIRKPFVEDVTSAAEWVRSQGFDDLIVVGSCYGARCVLAAAPDLEGVRSLVLLSAPVSDVHKGEGGAVNLVSNLSLTENAGRALRPHVLRDMVRGGRRRQYLRYVKSGLAASGARLLHRLGFSSSYDPAAASHRFLDPLEQVVARRIPTLFVFGAEHVTYKDFQRSHQGRLGRILERAGPLVQVVALEGEAYPFATISGQEAALRTIKGWIERSRVRQTQ